MDDGNEGKGGNGDWGMFCPIPLPSDCTTGVHARRVSPRVGAKPEGRNRRADTDSRTTTVRWHVSLFSPFRGNLTYGVTRLKLQVCANASVRPPPTDSRTELDDISNASRRVRTAAAGPCGRFYGTRRAPVWNLWRRIPPATLNITVNSAHIRIIADSP